MSIALKIQTLLTASFILKNWIFLVQGESARKGQPTISELSALQSQNISVCCAVNGTHGLILYKSLKGSFTRVDFRAFIVALVQECKKQDMLTIVQFIDLRNFLLCKNS